MDQYIKFFLEHIQTHIAPQLFVKNQSKPTVTFRAAEERDTAILFRFEIVAVEQTYPILVKMRHNIQGITETSLRPLRYKAGTREKFWLEAHGLETIEAHFKTLNQEAFGYVRVFDIIHEYEAIVMLEIHQPNLRQIFRKHNRIQHQFAPHNIQKIFFNAGAWLRHYHAIPPEEHVITCYDKPEHYIEGIILFTDYLSKMLKETYFNSLQSLLVEYAQSLLDKDLVLGRAHIDYAMRNILVDEANRITVIDTLAKWHTAIYDDIGYFLMRLHINPLQVITQGTAYSNGVIHQCYDSFLQGYFEEMPIPLETIKLYEVLALFDKWCSIIENYNSKKASASNTLRFQLSNTYFKRLIKHYMQDLANLT